MKKKIVLLAACFATTTMTINVSAANDVSVFVDGNVLVTDQPAVIMDGRTMVPIRAIAESLNIGVNWETNTKTVKFESSGTAISMVIGAYAYTLTKGGSSNNVSTDAPAVIINGRTLVPVRFVSNAFGKTVDWDAATKTVYIKSDAQTASTTMTVTSDSQLGYQKIEYSSGAVFEGEVVKGEPNGNGKFTWPNGDVYEGEFRNGNFNGKGKIIYADGDFYEGDFVEDLFEGYGTYTYASGGIYKGEFRNDYFNGKGKLTYADGNIYEGDFVDDIPEGYGTFTFADGDIYEGELRNGDFNGKGKLKWIDGDIYEGDFANDLPEGYGMFTFADGDVYEGEFLEGLFNGKGKITYTNGQIFEGNFENGKKEGEGTLKDLELGYGLTGIWVDDDLPEENVIRSFDLTEE